MRCAAQPAPGSAPESASGSAATTRRAGRVETAGISWFRIFLCWAKGSSGPRSGYVIDWSLAQSPALQGTSGRSHCHARLGSAEAQPRCAGTCSQTSRCRAASPTARSWWTGARGAARWTRTAWRCCPRTRASGSCSSPGTACRVPRLVGSALDTAWCHAIVVSGGAPGALGAAPAHVLEARARLVGRGWSVIWSVSARHSRVVGSMFLGETRPATIARMRSLIHGANVKGALYTAS